MKISKRYKNKRKISIAGKKAMKKGILRALDKKLGKIKSFDVFCNYCKKRMTVEERELQFPKKEKYYCSRICANTRIHTMATKEKIAKSLTKNNHNKICVICKKSFINNGKRKTCSKNCLHILRGKNNKKIKWTKKRRAKQSVSTINSIRTGKHNGGRAKRLFYKKIIVHGTFEVRTCHILDILKKKKEIISWEYSPLEHFEYQDTKGLTRNYLPDFKIQALDKNFYYLEIKGFKRENDNLKWDAVKKAGQILKVWYLKDIERKEKKLKIIIKKTL